MSETISLSTNQSSEIASSRPMASSSLVAISTSTQGLLLRMFADPRVLAKEESAELVRALREAVAHDPRNSDLRVLLGMALCVNLDPQAAMDELGEAVSLAPGSFIAHLKMGELWMRLRVMEKAEDHTRQAALLAESRAQSELARRQATTIRTMRREGIERDGYRTPWFSLVRLKRLWMKVRDRRRGAQSEELDTVEAQ